MQLNIIKADKKSPPLLWEWMKDKLPDSLCAIYDSDGYGGTYGIKVKVAKAFWFDFSFFKETIAYVEDGKVTVNHPNYWSDIEKLVLEYEHIFNREIRVDLFEAT